MIQRTLQGTIIGRLTGLGMNPSEQFFFNLFASLGILPFVVVLYLLVPPIGAVFSLLLIFYVILMGVAFTRLVITSTMNMSRWQVIVAFGLFAFLGFLVYGATALTLATPAAIPVIIVAVIVLFFFVMPFAPINQKNNKER